MVAGSAAAVQGAFQHCAQLVAQCQGVLEVEVQVGDPAARKHAGHRVVAPDLFGFGRCDKPQEAETYTFDFHRQSLLHLIERLDLTHITLVVQDWGGLIGLTLPMEMPGRFARLLVMNTDLATGDVRPNAAFYASRACSNTHPNMDVGALLRRAPGQITPEEARAYGAPFPDAPGAGSSRRARDWWGVQLHIESFMAVGMRDPILGAGPMRSLRSVIRGCPPPLEVVHGGHFVQEDAGETIAEAALQAFGLAGVRRIAELARAGTARHLGLSRFSGSWRHRPRCEGAWGSQARATA